MDVKPFPVRHRVVAVLFLAAAVAVVLWLVGAPKPWKVLAADPDLSRLKSLIRYYGWWAAAINASLLALLAATARFWAVPAPDLAARERWLPAAVLPRWFWPLVGAAALVVAVHGTMRIGQSLWDDEEASVRTYIHGEWVAQSDGSLKFRKPGWNHAFFNTRRATNHHLQTLVSRAVHEVWAAVARPGGLGMSETVMRIPVLVAGVLSVVVLALLLARTGMPRAGAVAAWLLAAHPWHMRYVTELRGYMFVMLLIPLLVLVLLRAVDRGTWRWWITFGACAFATLYAHAGSLYALALVHVLGLAAVWMRNPPGARAVQIARLLVAGTFAGMAYLQLMLPCVPQLAAYLGSDTMRGVLTPRWHDNLMSHFFCGIPWNNSESPAAGFPELRWIAGTRPALYLGTFFAAAAFAAAGLLRLLLAKPAGWLVAPALLLPPLAVYAVARHHGNYLYEWYLISALPGLVAPVAAGMDAACSPLARLHRFAPWVALVAALAIYWTVSAPARQWLLAHPVQPMRESVLAIRPSLDPFDPRQQTVITGRLNSPVRSYDPRAIPVHPLEALEEAMRRADATRQPFIVNFGNIHAASIDYPEILEILEDDRFFLKLPALPGLDPSLERHLRIYRHGSFPHHGPRTTPTGP
jgi:hypothetical protein